jgi:hypothetical protein
VLFAGYARYRHRLPLDLLAYGDPTAAEGLEYRWEDHNGDRTLQPGEVGALVARAGPGGASSSIDPGLRTPHTDEVALGLDARLSSTWTARLVGIHRREHDLVASRNVGAPASAYTMTSIPDPGGDILSSADDQALPVYNRRPESFGQDLYVLTNTDENALHEGIEASVRGSVGARLRVLFGATAYRSVGPGSGRGFRVMENDQDVVGERLEDPNALTYSRGRLFFDRAYTLKLAGGYHAPRDTRVALVARYQDGQPFARLVIAPDLNQGPEAIQAIPNGRSRFTYTLTVDARLEKGFRVGPARLAVRLSVFNVLGSEKEVEEDVTTGPSFRMVTAVQPPRALQLGVRLDF